MKSGGKKKMIDEGKRPCFVKGQKSSLTRLTTDRDIQ